MPPTSWSVPRKNALKWRQWDGDFILFDPASGDTHFLNGIAGSVLRLLESESATLEQIVAYLEKVGGEPLDRDVTEHLRELVDRLDAVGLIERVEP